MSKLSKTVIFSVFLCFASCGLILAATGNINTSFKYAWSNQIGWINFATNTSDVTVTDTAITGKAWSSNAGWINLNPTNGGVVNTTSGTLSGYAWGENVGWINFSGTTIGCDGQFAGTATGDVVGTVNFSCATCVVKTSWVPTVGCTPPPPPTPPGSSTPPPAPPPPPPPPPVTHNECSNLQCILVSGAGSDQCQTNSDCSTTHSECSNLQCVQVAGLGVDQCTTSADCAPQVHNECNAQHQCISVAGAGSDQCLTDSDCNVSHSECSNQQCILVNGVGVDQCTSNNDCAITAKHNECLNLQCVVVNSPGPDQCQTSADCKTTHAECSNLQCVMVPGVGINQCASNADCTQPVHNECNAQNQCMVVLGAGSDQCLTSADCATLPPGPNPPSGPSSNPGSAVIDQVTQSITDIGNNIGSAINEVTEKSVEVAVVVGQQVKEIVETPEGSVITKTISTTGVVVGTTTTVAFVVFSPGTLFELVFYPFRLMGLFLTFIGFRKKRKPWGIAYDAVTKQPLDPVYVSLKNTLGKEVASAITDIHGRYGFLVAPGTYYLSARKTNYAFPSVKLAGKNEDEIYQNLYLGEAIEIKDKNEVIAKNIPLDPLKFDWNEFAKRDKGFVKLYSKWDLALRKVTDIFFVIGFVVALVAYFAAPQPYNTIIAIVYLVLLLFRMLGLKPKAYGFIFDKKTGEPLSFAIIRIYTPSGIEISHKVADAYGRYYCLVPKGKYFVKIEKKNTDGSYSLIYTSPLINAARTGIIKEKFNVI